MQRTPNRICKVPKAADSFFGQRSYDEDSSAMEVQTRDAGPEAEAPFIRYDAMACIAVSPDYQWQIPWIEKTPTSIRIAIKEPNKSI